MIATLDTNYPSLRFSGFPEEWEVMTFESFLIDKFREVPKPETKYLALGVRSHGRGTFQKPDSDPSKIAMDSLFRVKTDDLIVNITFAWEGAIAIVKPEDEGGLVSHRFPTYVFDRKKVLPEFFRYVIEDRRFRHKLEVISPGGAGRNRVLSKKDFKKLKHSFPKVSEQEKVIKFLGSVDRKIILLEQKNELLNNFKTESAKKLFSQELRFTRDDGTDFPDWEETTIGEVGHFYYGKGAPKFSLSPDAPTPCVRYGELYRKYGIVIENVESRTTVDPSQLKFSKGGEILVPRVGENPLDFATCCYLPHAGVAIGEMISVFNTNENALFYTYYFRTLKKEFARVVEGGNVSNLYYAYLEPIKIGKPHQDEQEKIAGFLSKIDRKIYHVKRELVALREFRKGLLQQMFV